MFEKIKLSTRAYTVCFLVGLLVFVGTIFTLNLPSQIIQGEKGQRAIQLIDHTMLSLLDVRDAEVRFSELAGKKPATDDMRPALDKTKALLDRFQEKSLYNPALSEKAAALKASFEEWAASKRRLIEHTRETSLQDIDLSSFDRYLKELDKVSSLFLSIMYRLGEGEELIHHDIYSGRNATHILSVLIFLLASYMIGTTYLYQHSRKIDLVRSEENLQALEAETFNCIFIADVSGRIVYANRTFINLIGFSADNEAMLTLEDITEPEKFDEIMDRHKRWLEGEDLLHPFDTLFNHKDGTSIPVSLTAALTLWQKQKAVIIIAHSVTLGKEAFKFKTYTQGLQNLILDISTEFINIPKDKTDEIIEGALKRIGEFTGVDRCYIMSFDPGGETFTMTHEYVAPGIISDKEYTRNFPVDSTPWWTKQMRQGRTIHMSSTSDLPPEAYADKAVLESREVKSTVAIPLESNLSVIGILGISTLRQETHWADEHINLLKITGQAITNVFTRQTSETIIRRSEERFRTAIMTSPDAITITRARDGEIIEANKGFTKLLGFSRDEFLGRSSLDLGIWCSEEDLRKLVENLTKESVVENMEISYCRKDGSIANTLVSAREIDFDGELHVLAITKDIGDFKKAEKDLKRLFTFQELILEVLTSFIDLKLEETDSGINDSIEKMARFTGSDHSYVLLLSGDGTSYRMTHEWTTPEVSSVMETAQDIPNDAFSWVMDQIKQRGFIHVSSVAQLPPEAGTIKELWESHYVRSVIMIPMESNDTPIGFLGISQTTHERDWTSDEIGLIKIVAQALSNLRVRMRTESELFQYREHLEKLVEEGMRELKEAQGELLRTERLTALGHLTATVSHEIRNPLGTVRNSIFNIRDAFSQNDPDRVGRALELAERNIKRCDTIINELLDYTRERQLNSRPTNIDTWLGEIIDEQELPDDLELEFNPASGIDLSIDSELLRRAVLNIFHNAMQAVQEAGSTGSRMTLETGVTNDRLEIRVRDTGPGIPEDLREKIFEPLFSTKSFGVGLGIPIVKSIMEDHGGGIEVQSRVSQGTTVILWLPLT